MVGSCEACVRNLRSISSKPTVSVFSQTGVFAKGSAKEHPCLAHVLKHPTAALSTFCDTRGSYVPAILRDWQELDAEQAVVLSSFHKKKSKGERSGEHGRSKLDCAAQHCLAVITSSLQACDGALSRSNKTPTPRFHEGCAIGCRQRALQALL